MSENDDRCLNGHDMQKQSDGSWKCANCPSTYHARPFSELREKMSSDSQYRAAKTTEEVLAAMSKNDDYAKQAAELVDKWDTAWPEEYRYPQSCVRRSFKLTASYENQGTNRREEGRGMTGLQMKYFVLKPGGDDPYAIASRRAMRQYAHDIERENPQLAQELREWADTEKEKADAKKGEK